jgi:hypothetical protein
MDGTKPPIKPSLRKQLHHLIKDEPNHTTTNAMPNTPLSSGTHPEIFLRGRPLYKKNIFRLATTNQSVLPSRYLKLPEGD